MYVIYGYTSDIGLWDLEVFDNFKTAKEAFNSYVEDYNATISSYDSELLNYVGDYVEAMAREGGFFRLETIM